MVASLSDPSNRTTRAALPATYLVIFCLPRRVALRTLPSHLVIFRLAPCRAAGGAVPTL